MSRLKDYRFKLTAAQYRTIRRLYAKGWKQSAIAVKFGVRQQHISRIVRAA